ncbi:MAG: type II toxin-antitoxin system HicB family antitoxin [Pseudomonadota bacterium]
MLYPVYIHVGDETHAHGVSFPDFPGCFTAADAWEELPAMIQEAVEAHYGLGDEDIPPPSRLEDLMTHPDYQDGGVWLLADIDLSRINTRAMRINISLPEALVKTIDDEAKARHMSRSAFLAYAARRAMAESDKAA